MSFLSDDAPDTATVDEPAELPPTTSTTTTTTVPGPIRVVDGDAPLRVYVAGDSQATYLGQAVTTESDGWALDVEVEDRISMGKILPPGET